MAKKKPREVAESVLGSDQYLKEVLSLIPDDKKENVLSALGERVMARDEFSRAMDEIRAKDSAIDTYKAELDQWYGGKLDLLQKGTAALAELEKHKGTTPPAGGPGSDALKALEGYVKKEDVDKMVAATLQRSEETGLAIMTQIGALVSQHLHNYQEPLDTTGLIAHARGKNISIQAAYDEITSEKREKREAGIKAAERKKLEDEIRSQLQKEMGHGVYPVNADEPSPTLAGLNAANKKSAEGEMNFGVKAAIDEYYRMNRS